MKVEKRGDKYYYKCEDGEVERTEEEFIQDQDGINYLLEYGKAFISKYEHQHWPTNKIPKDAVSNIRLDLYFGKMEKDLIQLLEEKSKVEGFEIVCQKILLVVDILISNYEGASVNPLAKEHVIYSYAIKHLQAIKNKIKIYETFDRQKITVKSKEVKSRPIKHKDIAIAYFFIGKPIKTKEMAARVLAKHAKHLTSPDNLYQERISKISQVISMSDDRSAATKHLHSLYSAERLIKGMKNKEAEAKIKDAITTYLIKYNQNQ